ncbi:MAG: Ig-like domain-containing protein, partial [Gemmatimonadetes bacterium]|nr:Ig-like domain-containing protein [Gemmatimonadota bacterium]
MNPRLVGTLTLLAATLACERFGPGASRQVVVEPQVVNLEGAGKQLIVSARLLIGGRWLPDSSRFTWRSANAQVAFVSDSGVVTAVAEGVARVWAVRGSDSAFATVVVQGGAVVAAAETTAAITPTVALQVAPARLALDAFGVRTDLKATVTGQGADSTPVSCTS